MTTENSESQEIDSPSCTLPVYMGTFNHQLAMIKVNTPLTCKVKVACYVVYIYSQQCSLSRLKTLDSR